MSYLIRGRIDGRLCDDCTEPLSGSTIRFYAAAGDQVVARAAAAVKDTLAPLDADQVQERAGRLVGEAVVQADGSYRAEIAVQSSDVALDVDLYCGTVPTTRPPTHQVDPVQFHVTTIAPAWREVGDDRIAALEYVVPQRIWCGIRARFGVWVICGHVLVCATKAPVSNVVVKAFDVDWLQDDSLGSGITDATGHFRIDYLTSDFTRTPFTWIDVEWVGGPDLYFRVETSGGTPLLVEPRSEGRTPGRENVGPCTCVDLCLTGDVPGNPPTIPLFTSVGDYRVAPTSGDFTADGTTTAGELAFTGDIPLDGILPDALSADALEYRFTVNALPGGPAVPVDATQLAPTVIGALEFLYWDTLLASWTPGWAPFHANTPGASVAIAQAPPVAPLVVDTNVPVGVDGWIAVPRVNGLVPGGPGRFVLSGNTHLGVLHTAAYTDESFDLTALPLDAGDDVPLVQRSGKPLFGITFEARQAAGHAPVGTNTLPVIAFSNIRDRYDRHPYWAGGVVTTTGVASLGIAEMAAAGGCAEMGDEIHLLYTGYHPYIGAASVYFEGNPILPAPVVPVPSGGQVVSAAGGDVVDTSLLARCAYILWLSVPLRLTSGAGQLPVGLEDHIAFCKK